jgi:hypothetical protein
MAQEESDSDLSCCAIKNQESRIDGQRELATLNL